jgi:transposase
VVDGRGRSLATLITPGRSADTRQLTRCWSGPGDPRTVPAASTSETGKRRIRHGPPRTLRDKRLGATIPQPADQIGNRLRKGRNGGRPPVFDSDAYKRRNQAGRGFNRRKHWRGPATRYDKGRLTGCAPCTGPPRSKRPNLIAEQVYVDHGACLEAGGGGADDLGHGVGDVAGQPDAGN